MGKILILKYGKELNFIPYYTYILQHSMLLQTLMREKKH